GGWGRAPSGPSGLPGSGRGAAGEKRRNMCRSALPADFVTRRRDDLLADFKAHGRIVIVGASLAGLSAAETLRAERFDGYLTIIGDEPDLPYDRPPLPKPWWPAGFPPSAPFLPAGGPWTGRDGRR